MTQATLIDSSTRTDAARTILRRWTDLLANARRATRRAPAKAPRPAVEVEARTMIDLMSMR